MTTRKTAINSDDLMTQRPRAMRIDEVDTLMGDDAQNIVMPSMFQDVPEYEKFMNDYLEIVVAASSDKNAPPMVPVGVNGRQVWLPRGQNVEVRRYFVERLLRAQPRDFKTVNEQDFGAETATRIAESIGTSYPISIINDPDPRGRDWANMVSLQAC